MSLALSLNMLKSPRIRMFIVKELTRQVYGYSRIGNREVVGFGHNGSYNYRDDALFPFPSIRFMELDKEVCCLKEKEKGDWRELSCEEKKALYRASFCQTFAEFQHPTGTWKFVLGCGLFALSFGAWMAMFEHNFVKDPQPEWLGEEYQAAKLRRILELRINAVDGISSKWDYAADTWK